MQKKRLDISIDSETAKEMQEYSLRKYGNSRSLSKMIEDLWRDRESLDEEEIKANRNRYNDLCEKLCEENNLKGHNFKFKCKNCDAEFYARPPDAWSCPSCSSIYDLVIVGSYDEKLKPLIEWFPHHRF
jgi:hypothetical protein